jgi:hypothetical protein
MTPISPLVLAIRHPITFVAAPKPLLPTHIVLIASISSDDIQLLLIALIASISPDDIQLLLVT